jgi:metallo-beta-lactamase family protein
MAVFESFGGAGLVTGSCHKIEINDISILIDCGMFQGDDEGLNHEGFAFDVSQIDYLFVTHAHLDHIGRIPMLVKHGFNGKIISTRATYSIAKLMLHNAAGIIEENTNPLYTSHDVNPALAKFDRFVEFDETITISEGIRVTFKNAGHILGSATIKFEFKEEGETKSIVFSGDIGQEHRIITSSLERYKEANYIFLEATYGDRLHKNINVSIMELKTYIEDVAKSGGTILIPSFALERTQEILYLLRQLSLKGVLKKIPVYLDSPLAINVTKTFLNYPQLFSKEIQKLIENNVNPFDFEELVHTQSKEASKKIIAKSGAKIIIAGSGMCEGGRITNHLIHYLGVDNALVLFVGFQVPGTLGHTIVNKKVVDINGIKIKKAAVVKYIDGFSAHADRDDLIDWVSNVKGLKKIFLIHGDEERLHQFQAILRQNNDADIEIVRMRKKINI